MKYQPGSKASGRQIHGPLSPRLKEDDQLFTNGNVPTLRCNTPDAVYIHWHYTSPFTSRFGLSWTAYGRNSRRSSTAQAVLSRLLQTPEACLPATFGPTSHSARGHWRCTVNYYPPRNSSRDQNVIINTWLWFIVKRVYPLGFLRILLINTLQSTRRWLVLR